LAQVFRGSPAWQKATEPPSGAPRAAVVDQLIEVGVTEGIAEEMVRETLGD